MHRAPQVRPQEAHGYILKARVTEYTQLQKQGMEKQLSELLPKHFWN